MEVFGLSSGGEDRQDLNVFTAAFQVSFPILTDASSTYYLYQQPGAVSPYPLDFIIDQAGRVAYANTEYDPEAMVAMIDFLLAHPAPVGEIPAAADLQITSRPNPFNPRTEILFTLPTAGVTTVDIHDARGHLVRRLVQRQGLAAGENSAFWDGLDDSGRALPTGLYLVRVRSGSYAATGKLTLVR